MPSGQRLAESREKSLYCSGRVSDCYSDQTALFRVIDDLWYKPTTSALPYRASLQELVEEFGSFFRTKIDNISQRLDSLPEASITQPVERKVAAVLREFVPVTELEVLKIIRRSSKKNCQLNSMPTQVMMDHVLDLLPVITRIINTPLAIGHVPASMKTALSTPLIKKPSLDKEVLRDYRPVPNFTFPSKLLKTVVSARLREYLAANCLLEPRQSAYIEQTTAPRKRC